MSDQTKANLEAALEAHIADETEGGMVTGYVTHVAYQRVDLGSASGYRVVTGTDQAFHVGLGLVHMLTENFDAASMFTYCCDRDEYEPSTR